MSVQQTKAADTPMSLHDIRNEYRKQVIASLRSLAERDRLYASEVRDAVLAAEEFGVDVAFYLIKHQYFKASPSICTIGLVTEVVSGYRTQLTQGYAIYPSNEPQARTFCEALIEGIEATADNFWLKVT